MVDKVFDSLLELASQRPRPEIPQKATDPVHSTQPLPGVPQQAQLPPHLPEPPPPSRGVPETLSALQQNPVVRSVLPDAIQAMMPSSPPPVSTMPMPPAPASRSTTPASTAAPATPMAGAGLESAMGDLKDAIISLRDEMRASSKASPRDGQQRSPDAGQGPSYQGQGVQTFRANFARPPQAPLSSRRSMV